MKADSRTLEQIARDEAYGALVEKINAHYPTGEYDLHHELTCFYVEHMPREKLLAWREQLVRSEDADRQMLELIGMRLSGEHVSDIPLE